jgi:hypothetical protein
VTPLAPPDADEAVQQTARVGHAGSRFLVWMRGSGHRRPERWHLRTDIPAVPDPLTQVVAACGAWFRVSDVTDLAFSGWTPVESDRCPGCELARRTD